MYFARVLDRDRLQAVKTIVVHANCADGLLSAILLQDALPNANDIRFMQYGEDQLLLRPEPNMLFCDFSPHESTAQAFVESGAIVLDHHKTARPVVEAFGESGVFGDEVKDLGVCGASLAFREVWKPLKGLHVADLVLVKNLVRRAGVRDTWLRGDPEWVDACEQAEALLFYRPGTWLVADAFVEARKAWWAQRLSIGHRLIERKEETIEGAVDRSFRFSTTSGTKVCMFTGLRLVSDAAESLGEALDVVAAFDFVAEHGGLVKLIYSLRSHTGFDCGAFCKARGGGGHTAAAGFSLLFDPSEGASDPFSILAGFLEEWEAVGGAREPGATGSS